MNYFSKVKNSVNAANNELCACNFSKSSANFGALNCGILNRSLSKNVKNNFKANALKLGAAAVLGVSSFTLSGCISPVADAFILGAGAGALTTGYFLEGGKIDGISRESAQTAMYQATGLGAPANTQYQNAYARAQARSANAGFASIDSSIPADLEWYYFEREMMRDLGY